MHGVNANSGHNSVAGQTSHQHSRQQSKQPSENTSSDKLNILNHIRSAFQDNPRLACSVEDFKMRNRQVPRQVFNDWQRTRGTDTTNGNLVEMSKSQHDYLRETCSKSQRLFSKYLKLQPDEPDFKRIRKRNTGLNRSYYIFTTPKGGGNFERRVIESVRSPNLTEYAGIFEQLKGFSPTLWRAFLEHNIDRQAKDLGGRLGRGGFSTVKLGYEICRTDHSKKYLALKLLKPQMQDNLQAQEVIRPEVPYENSEFLLPTSDYFPDLRPSKSSQGARNANQEIQPQPAQAQRAQADQLNALPSYYSISALGYSSLAEIIKQCNIGSSAFGLRGDPQELNQYVSNLLNFMPSNDKIGLSGRSTIEQRRFSAAKFVYYMRTTGIDRANCALFSLTKQLIDAVLNLHKQKKCHGDIKPANCLLVPDEQDFTSNELILKLADIDSLSDIDSDARVITPMYSVPSRPGDEEVEEKQNKAIHNDRHALGITIEDLAKAIDELNTFRQSFIPEKPTKKDQASLQKINTWQQSSTALKSIGFDLYTGYKTIKSRDYAISLAKLMVLKFEYLDAFESRAKPNKITEAEKHLEKKSLKFMQEMTKAHNLRHSDTLEIHKLITSPNSLCKSETIKILGTLGVKASMGQNYIDKIIKLSRNLAKQKLDDHNWTDLDLNINLNFLHSKEVLGQLQHAKSRIDAIESTVLSCFSGGSWDTGIARPTVEDINLLSLFSLSVRGKTTTEVKTKKNQIEQKSVPTQGEQFAELKNDYHTRKVFQATFASTIEATPLAQGRAIIRDRGGFVTDLRECDVLNAAEKTIFKQLYGKKPSSIWYNLRDEAGQWNYARAVTNHYANNFMDKVKHTGHSVSRALHTLGAPLMGSRSNTSHLFTEDLIPR